MICQPPIVKRGLAKLEITELQITKLGITRVLTPIQRSVIN